MKRVVAYIAVVFGLKISVGIAGGLMLGVFLGLAAGDVGSALLPMTLVGATLGLMSSLAGLITT